MEQSPWEDGSHSASQEIPPPFYGNRRFITVFTTARHWSLSWAKWIQSTPPNPISLTSILMLSFHLRLVVTVSSQHVSRPKFCIHSSCLPCVLHAPPISSSSNIQWSVAVIHMYVEGGIDEVSRLNWQIFMKLSINNSNMADVTSTEEQHLCCTALTALRSWTQWFRSPNDKKCTQSFTRNTTLKTCT
jgi:hypothetical protein